MQVEEGAAAKQTPSARQQLEQAMGCSLRPVIWAEGEPVPKQAAVAGAAAVLPAAETAVAADIVVGVVAVELEAGAEDSVGDG